MTVAQLKVHLKERGISTEGVLERQDLIELALGESGKGKVDVQVAAKMSEHLLEC